MFAPAPHQPRPGRRRAAAALAASALLHGALLAWLSLRAPARIAPERALEVVFLKLQRAAPPAPPSSPGEIAAERQRQAYLDRLVQPAAAPEPPPPPPPPPRPAPPPP